MVGNKNKQDTLVKACLKTILILILLSTIGFVVSYVLIYAFERLLKVNDNYTVFELMYKDGASVKYFSSAKIKILIQTMVYMINVFVMFLISLNIYFKRNILSKKDSILYSLFLFIILYASSFVLIKIGINTINNVIESFNNVILTYNTNTFEEYLNKLSNLRMLVTIIYSFGATVTCLFSLIIIRSGVDEVEELDKANKEKKIEEKKGNNKKEEKKEESKEKDTDKDKEDKEVKDIPKEEDIPKKEDIPEEVKIIKKEEVSNNKDSDNIEKKLDAEEKRIVSELNVMLNKINLDKDKKDKEETKVSFVGQSKKKKK